MGLFSSSSSSRAESNQIDSRAAASDLGIGFSIHDGTAAVARENSLAVGIAKSSTFNVTNYDVSADLVRYAGELGEEYARAGLELARIAQDLGKDATRAASDLGGQAFESAELVARLVADNAEAQLITAADSLNQANDELARVSLASQQHVADALGAANDELARVALEGLAAGTALSGDSFALVESAQDELSRALAATVGIAEGAETRIGKEIWKWLAVIVAGAAAASFGPQIVRALR